MMHTLPGKQNGLTAISWVLILAVLAFFVLLALKLVPVYIEGYSAYSVLSSVAKEPGMAKKSYSEIKKSILRRLDINMVYNVTRDDIYISKEKNSIQIELDYEIREPFISNIDFVIAFNKKVVLPN